MGGQLALGGGLLPGGWVSRQPPGCHSLKRISALLSPPSLHPLPCGLFPGLGFESCATPVLNISRAQLSANKSFQLEGEAVEPDQ